MPDYVKPVILYVDDEPANLLGFRYSFIDEYEIITARSGSEALNIVEQRPDIKVVITDQRMPEMEGHELLELLARHFPDPVRIILSAYADMESIMRAINSGTVYRYLTKPWQKNELNNAIQNAVEAYELRKENRSLIISLTEANLELSAAIQRLAASEKNFRNFFNFSLDAILITDSETNILEVNPIFVKRSGYEAKEIYGRSVYDFISPEFHKPLQMRREAIEAGQNELAEIVILTKSGQRILVEVNTQIIEFNDKPAFLTIARDISERKLTEKRILKAIIETEEREKERFAAELHDGLGPIFSSLKLYLNSLNSDKYTEAQKRDMLQIANGIIDEAVVTTRSLSNNLMPTALAKFGIDSTLRSFCDKINQAGEIAIDYSSNHPAVENQDAAIALYRIVLELINNTLRHAGATRISILLESSNKEILLSYNDNGIGLNPQRSSDAGNNGEGHGLKNIMSRIKMFDGSIRFTGKTGEGFAVEIRLPLDSK